MRFAVEDDAGGHATWKLFGDNNKLVAWAGESFASRSNAERAALALKAGASTARYDIYEDSGSHWRWRALRSSDKVAASGESFASKYDAERAAENVRDNAGSATGP
jgi:uncharacterized protein YegP (UPF0339 family)